MLTGRINAVQTEKPKGWDCQPPPVMELLWSPWLEWCPSPLLSFDTWELALAPWVSTLAWPIKSSLNKCHSLALMCWCRWKFDYRRSHLRANALYFQVLIMYFDSRLPAAFQRANTKHPSSNSILPSHINHISLWPAAAKPLKVHTPTHFSFLYAKKSLFYLVLWQISCRYKWMSSAMATF